MKLYYLDKSSVSASLIKVDGKYYNLPNLRPLRHAHDYSPDTPGCAYLLFNTLILLPWGVQGWCGD